MGELELTARRNGTHRDEPGLEPGGDALANAGPFPGARSLPGGTARIAMSQEVTL